MLKTTRLQEIRNLGSRIGSRAMNCPSATRNAIHRVSLQRVSTHLIHEPHMVLVDVWSTDLTFAESEPGIVQVLLHSHEELAHVNAVHQGVVRLYVQRHLE